LQKAEKHYSNSQTAMLEEILQWRNFSTEVNRNENIEIMVDNKSRTIKWEIGYT
jgi:hypothetical protein